MHVWGLGRGRVYVYIYVYRLVHMYVSCTVFTFSWPKKQIAHLGFSSA